ncbi:flavodoxin domain-containing protein [Chitinophaga sp. CC14]|uniref:flavodoxin domain-containing protein n=1 Tax=Chitinophaga sp. CC14 TaxID=3029199 RepID=UPI003B785405
MKGLIIYKGKYGATRQYALWLGSMLGWPVIPAGSETAQQLADADCIILGSSIYIGKLQLRKWLEQHGDAIISKRLFLFLVSGTPSSDKGKLEGYLAANISESLRSRCVPFFLPGKLEFNKLSWIDKLLLTMAPNWPAIKRMTSPWKIIMMLKKSIWKPFLMLSGSRVRWLRDEVHHFGCAAGGPRH